MPKLSIFTPTGLLRMSSDPSYAETIYDSIVDGEQEAFDMSDGTAREARAYAMAMGLAGVRCTIERAGNQVHPPNCNDLLPDFEQRFGLAPGAYDTIQQRQAALAAKEKFSLGAVRSSVVASLRSLLGADFLALRLLTSSEISTVPSSPSSAVTHCTDVRVPPKFAKLVDPVGVIGAAAVLYENLQPDEAELHLKKGDDVVVQPGNSARQERVTITSVGGTGTFRFFTASFTKAHDIGSIVTTMDYPYQWSTRRFMLVIVTHAVALDSDKRQRINEVMRSLTRSVDTWAIVQPVNPNALFVGPMGIGTFVIGTATLGQIPFVLEP